MAMLKIEAVLDHLSNEMRQALDEAVRETIPEAQFDAFELFRAYLRAVRRKCESWESIPDTYLE